MKRPAIRVSLTVLVSGAIIGLTALSALLVAFLLQTTYDNQLTESFYGRVQAESREAGLDISLQFDAIKSRLAELAFDDAIADSIAGGLDRQLQVRLGDFHGQPPGAVFFARTGPKRPLLFSGQTTEEFKNLGAGVLAGTAGNGEIFHGQGGAFAVGFSLPVWRRMQQQGTVGGLFSFSPGAAATGGKDGADAARLILLSNDGFWDLTSGQLLSVRALGTVVADNLTEAVIGDSRGVLTTVEKFPGVHYFVSTAGLERTRDQGLLLAIAVPLGVGLFSVWAAFYLGRRITLPLRAVVERARDLASGRVYSSDIKGASNIIELNQFSDSLIEIVTNLKHAQSELQDARDQLEERVEERTSELQREIAQRARTESNLRNSESRFKAFIDNTPSAILLKEPDGRYILANRIWHQWFNPDGVDVVGKTVYDFFPEGHAEEVKEQDQQVIDSGVVIEHEIRTPRPDGTVLITMMQKFPVLDQDGRLFAIGGINTDITDRKRSEELLLTAKEAAVSASHAKSEFLAHMSHELRTPLNSILGFSQVLESEAMGRHAVAKYKEYSADILRSGELLLAVINDILDISKIESGEVEVDDGQIDAGALVDACLRMVAGRAEAGKVTVDVRVDDGVGALRADERLVKQAILNLLSNAIKFTPAGGRVGVAVSASGNGAITFAIADTGIGIAPKDMETVLEPFGQVRESQHLAHQGTGLGLPIAKRLMELHGGVLVMTSVPGEGTTVEIRFPAARTIPVTAA